MQIIINLDKKFFIFFTLLLFIVGFTVFSRAQVPSAPYNPGHFADHIDFSTPIDQDVTINNDLIVGRDIMVGRDINVSNSVFADKLKVRSTSSSIILDALLVRSGGPAVACSGSCSGVGFSCLFGINTVDGNIYACSQVGAPVTNCICYKQ